MSLCPASRAMDRALLSSWWSKQNKSAWPKEQQLHTCSASLMFRNQWVQHYSNKVLLHNSHCRWAWRHSPAGPAAAWRSRRGRARWRTWAPSSPRRPGCWRRRREPAELEPCPSCRDWPPASAPSGRPAAGTKARWANRTLPASTPTRSCKYQLWTKTVSLNEELWSHSCRFQWSHTNIHSITAQPVQLYGGRSLGEATMHGSGKEGTIIQMIDVTVYSWSQDANNPFLYFNMFENS